MGINNSRAVLGPNKDAQIAEQQYLKSVRAVQGGDRRMRWAFKKAMRQGDFQGGASILQGARSAGLDPFRPGSMGINSSEDQKRNAQDLMRRDGAAPTAQLVGFGDGRNSRNADLLDQPGKGGSLPSNSGVPLAGEAIDLLSRPVAGGSFAEQDAAARERSYASGAFGGARTAAGKERTRELAAGFRAEDENRRLLAAQDEKAMKSGVYDAPPDQPLPLTPLEEGQRIADASRNRAATGKMKLESNAAAVRERVEQMKGKALRDLDGHDERVRNSKGFLFDVSELRQAAEQLFSSAGSREGLSGDELKNAGFLALADEFAKISEAKESLLKANPGNASSPAMLNLEKRERVIREVHQKETARREGAAPRHAGTSPFSSYKVPSAL